MPINDSQGSTAAIYKVNTLQCGSTIVRNGITYYDQQTIPTSPKIGDMWYERDINKNILQQWFWNGSYWVSVQEFGFYLVNGGLAWTTPIISTYSQIYVSSVFLNIYSNGTANNDANNYSTNNVNIVTLAGVSTAIATITTQSLLNNQKKTYSANVNTFYSTAVYQAFTITSVNTGIPKESAYGSGLIKARFAR